MTSRSGLWRLLRAVLLVALVLGALLHASGVRPLRFITALELAIADARQRLLMPGTLDARIVIVDVDEKSLAEVGRWPWGRDRLAALTNELFERQKAAVVGFDMLFAEPDTSADLAAIDRLQAEAPDLAPRLRALRSRLDHDAEFARALNGRNAVLGYYLTSDRDGHTTGVLPAPVFDASALRGRRVALTHWDGYAASLPLLARAAPSAGFFNAVPDADGLVRSVPLLAEHGGRYYAPLVLAMFRAYTGAPETLPGFANERAAWHDHDALDRVVLRQNGHEVSIPVDERGRVRVPFRGEGGPHGGSFRYVSAADLLAGRVPAGNLAGKLVIVGTTAPGLYDQRSTPVAAVYPGVEVHANLLSGLLDGRVPAQPAWASAFEVPQLLFIAGLLGLAVPRLRALRAVQLTFVLVGTLLAVNLWSYRAHGLLLPLAASLLLACAMYVSITVWAYIVEGRSRRSLARLFGTYVPPELVEEMARDPARYDMRAENRELTVMFCDMRNFTRVSELLAPEDVRSLVNRFFSSMTGAIRECRGTLDKYIGDAIMAFWGAPVADPAHAAHAVHAALAMMQRLHALNADLRARGLPEIGLGIGLNTGTVCVGDMGSSMRRSYTVMGDAVNLASRVEALTRYYGLDLLVGEATRSAADAAPAAGLAPITWVEVDRVRVKGKQQGVTLFTPVQATITADPTFDEEMRLWRLALATYRLQHWPQALAHLNALRTTYPESEFAGLYQQFDERIQHLCTTPPPTGWDGAHTFDSK